MATSAVEICNDALGIIGAEFITDLTDTSKEGVLCNEQYAKARDQLLSAHPWNFAITRVELAADANLPSGWDDGTWDSAFTLPSDCLRVLSIDDSQGAWAQESGKLFTNYAPVFVKYIKKVTNTSLFSKHFEKALAYELALKLCYALTQSASAVQLVKQLRDEAVAEARSMDGQEGSVQVVEASDFYNSRF